ncbi:hypothetical protein [Mesorhizobium sp. M0847]|uniref:hypothetical protein n=1 Tax=unclassified Mesorhizobium TaxID=325217 RepID=UPI00333CA1E4
MDETHGKPEAEPDAGKRGECGEYADGRGQKTLKRPARIVRQYMPDDRDIGAAKHHNQGDRHPEQDDDCRSNYQPRQVRLFGGRVAIALEGG